MKVKIGKEICKTEYPFETVNVSAIKMRDKYIYIPLDWYFLSKDMRQKLALRMNRMVGDEIIYPDNDNWCGLFMRSCDANPFYFNVIYLSYHDFYIEDIAESIFAKLLDKPNELKDGDSLILPAELSEKEKIILLSNIWLSIKDIA